MALVEDYGAIFIGNVNASVLVKTRMAKSLLDAVRHGPMLKCKSSAITPVCGSMGSMKRIQPSPVTDLKGAQA